MNLDLTRMPADPEELAALAALESECLRVLGRADRGVIGITCHDAGFCANVPIDLSNGWKLWVFDDVGEWDYIDSIQRPGDPEPWSLWRGFDEGPWDEWVSVPRADRGPEPEVPLAAVRAWRPDPKNLWRWGARWRC